MRTALKKLTALLIALLFFNFSLFSQVTQPGGVVSYVIKKEAVTDPALIPALTNAEMARAISYVDGFGRPLQNIVVAGSPNGKDIVSFKKYDEYGRQPKQYLPFEATTTTGAYNDMSTIVSDQSIFYSPLTSASKKIAGDDYPYTESSFETSPLGRVLKVGGVGDGFQITQHYKTMSYHNGLGSENIRKWILGSSTATSSATYGDDELIVSEVTDENSIHAWVYKDRFGRLILKRQDGLSAGHYYDTYYVYDNIGNIAYIVPPKAIAKLIGIGGTYSTSSIPELIYQFWYDGKNRINHKKVPGAKEVYIIYDPLDRVVLTQDGNMRSSSGTKWAYVKYDNANRVIIQGIYTHGSVLSQSAMQSYVDGQTVYSSGSYYEIRQSGTSGYSNQCFPTSSTEERGYNYYDHYDFDLDFNPDYSKQAQGLTNEAAATNLTYGLLTGTKRKILGSGTPGTWLIEASFYDKYYHVIQVRSNNQIKTAVTDHTTNVVNFAGQALEAKQVKVINDPYGITNTLVIQVSTRYEYDDMGRLLKVKQTNPGSSELIVAQYEYNVIGQLVDKKLHSTDGGINYLQSVDMRYNIRGQLTSINNSGLTDDVGVTNDETNDVFGMELLYEKEDIDLGNTANHSGMISGVKWSAQMPGTPKPDERSFIYSYDNLYRLTNSVYKAKDNGTTSWIKDLDGFNESLTYDENGNIKTLQRNAMLGTSLTQIDDLIYNYKSSDNENQLDYVRDNISTNTTGYGYRNFTGTVSPTPYSYDDNGNLTTDLNKGTTISYNELNKPTLIQISSTKKVEYRYDAAGTRISKYVTNSGSTKYIEYIGGYVIENDVLSYYSMAEGRARNGGGGYSLTIAMEYFITDHQGNTRVSFEDDGTSSNTAIVTQENSYYAFGMQMAGGWTPTNPNKKLYNAGSEWQDDIDGLADYYSTFFREYDPMIGRFNGVDPMAEVTDNITTYAYANNNPVMMNDPLGNTASRAKWYEKIAEADPYEPQWNNARSWEVMDRIMGASGWGDWTFDAGTGGTGTYAALKEHLDYFGSAEWQEVYDAANMSKYVYGEKDAKLTGGWQVSSLYLGQIDDDISSGFKGQLFEKVENGKVVAYTYAFAGTQDKVDGWEDVLQLAGKSTQYHIAFNNARLLDGKLGNLLSFTGHSLGGGLASLAALVTNKRAITFNAAGLSTETEKKYNTLDKSGRRITAIIVSGEIVNRFQRNWGLQFLFGLHQARGEKKFITNPYLHDPVELHKINSVIEALEF